MVHVINFTWLVGDASYCLPDICDSRNKCKPQNSFYSVLTLLKKLPKENTAVMK